MELLLDTHAVIWFLSGDERITKKAIRLIENIENKNFVSTASIWEITIKSSIGKLNLKGDLNDIRNQFIQNGFELLPISFEPLIVLHKLEFKHRDPFNRLIISQAIAHGFPVVTKDANFKKYDIQVIW